MRPILKYFTIILFLIQSLILQAQAEKQSFLPKVKYGKALFSGKITGKVPHDLSEKSILLSFSNLVTSNTANYEVPIKKDGTFSIEIPVQCITFPVIESDYYANQICLIPGEETRLELNFDGNKTTPMLTNRLGFNANDSKAVLEVFDEVLEKITTANREIVTPEIYKQGTLKSFSKGLELFDKSEKLSGISKQVAISEFKAWYIKTYLFNYALWIGNNYENKHRTDSMQTEFRPQIPAKSYYSFLKDVDLTNPANFTARFYPDVLQLILSNDTLAIPAIEDMPVDTWLVQVKTILNDLIGPGTGQFYELLVSNAYGKQFNEMKPLSETQKKNIASYFKNKSFIDILLAENERVVRLANKNRDEHFFIFNKPVENVMDQIISKYKEKVVFVDFWATWCSPCLKAMQESGSVRKELENKGVVFVYITDPTSPIKAWQLKIADIHGEHYYLTKEDWKNLTKKYNFSAIPHYLIFDKNGSLKQNLGAFINNEDIRKWINELL